MSFMDKMKERGLELLLSGAALGIGIYGAYRIYNTDVAIPLPQTQNGSGDNLSVLGANYQLSKPELRQDIDELCRTLGYDPKNMPQTELFKILRIADNSFDNPKGYLGEGDIDALRRKIEAGTVKNVFGKVMETQ